MPKRETATDRNVGMVICEGVWRGEEVFKAEVSEKLMCSHGRVQLVCNSRQLTLVNERS
jgi:hypothetical protein